MRPARQFIAMASSTVGRDPGDQYHEQIGRLDQLQHIRGSLAQDALRRRL